MKKGWLYSSTNGGQEQVAPLTYLDCIVDGAGNKAQLASNPNLLINGDFRVWRRGTSFTANGYCADRWLAVSSGTGFVINDWTGASTGGLAITTTGMEADTYVDVMQMIEDKSIIGKTLTLSTAIEGLSKSTTFTMQSSGTSDLVASNDGKVQVIACMAYNGYPCVILRVYGGVTVGAAWIKLEVGNAATAFIARPMAEERMLCQRYYQRTSQIISRAADVHDNSFYYPMMRAKPTASIVSPNGVSDKAGYRQDGVWVDVDATVSAQADAVRVYSNARQGVPTTYSYRFALDAEIY